MNQKELKELIEFLIEKDIAEFELERGDVKVKIKRGREPVPAAVPDARFFAVHSAPLPSPELGTAPVLAGPAAAASAAATPPPVPEEALHIVRSPSWARSTSRLLPDLRRL